jgi:hypothetical protein
MSSRLAIELGGGTGLARYHPGDWVRGHVRVQERCKSRALQVALHFRESSPDYDSVAARYEIPPLHEGDLEAGSSFEFAIQIPHDALPDLTSRHGSLWWEVEAKSDERGPDTRIQERIQVTRQAAATAGRA